MSIQLREITPADRPWVRQFLLEQFGWTIVVSRGRLHHADRLAGFIGLWSDSPAALLTYDIRAGELEVVSLHSSIRRRGLGSALLEAAVQVAQARSCRRVWAITTNDNRPAIRFYTRCGWRQVAVHQGAVAEARKLKPEIPEIGLDGIPIRDEIEFELPLVSVAESAIGPLSF